VHPHHYVASNLIFAVMWVASPQWSSMHYGTSACIMWLALLVARRALGPAPPTVPPPTPVPACGAAPR